VIEIMVKARNEKDMKTVEFMLKMIPTEAIPLLFAHHDWECEDYYGHDHLDKTCRFDSLIDELHMFTADSEFDYLNELYNNDKFSIPDLKKQRIAQIHIYVKYVSSGNFKAIVGNTGYNLLFGEVKDTFFSENKRKEGNYYREEVEDRLDFPEYFHIQQGS
jgi:hypothetical protein